MEYNRKAVSEGKGGGKRLNLHGLSVEKVITQRILLRFTHLSFVLAILLLRSFIKYGLKFYDSL